MKRLFVALLPALLLSAAPTRSHEGADQLGKVSFPTSCDAKVQAQFERGVAMIHSYWFGEARKTFESVLKQDPSCAIAYWGIAVDLLGNTLVAPPSRSNAQSAWEALEKARAIGAKTQRERDWIEALSAYYRDHDKVPVDARLRAYDNAMAGNDATLSGRLRGMDLLCADAPGYRARTRQDIREPAQVGGDPREAPAAESRNIPACGIF